MTPAGRGRFDRTLAVTGPVRLEVTGGSGEIRIERGQNGQVRVQGEFEVYAHLGEDAAARVQNIEKNPPIEQQGDTIRIGLDREYLRSVRVSYTITAPEDTMVRASARSGSVSASGFRGPARLSAGSGNVSAAQIRGDVETSTGSGNQRLKEIDGAVRARTGSGDLTLDGISGEVRAETGSGRITVMRPGGRIQLHSASGDQRISDVKSDLRAECSSGRISIAGAPRERFYWEVRTRSGDVSLDLAQSTSFRLEARTRSSEIRTDIPLTLEEKNRRLLRARAGDGQGRITVETSSGRIRIR
jgi:DUF4097 and DUF4098 domain-containing protein YvlB